MLVRGSSALVCLAGLFVVRMGVLVSVPVSFPSSSVVNMWTGLDIGDFLKEEIKGPAKFSCKSGSGCKFEEPAMNDLIDQIFGDAYITLECEGGELLALFAGSWIYYVPEWDTNSTAYACERVKCACVPGRFICGVFVSVSISFCC